MTAPKLRTFVLAAPALLLGLLALACVAWAIGDAPNRPADYPEACVLFNASRLRDGLPLYVDPIHGAKEYGEPPARYFVAYTPLYAAIVAAAPAVHAATFGRLIGLTAWIGALVFAVVHARSGLRKQATLAALFVGSIFLFARWSAAVKGDGIALLLAGVAFARLVRRRGVGPLESALFALGWLFKTSVAGLAMGTVLASMTLPGTRRRLLGPLAAGALLLCAIALLLVVSDGDAIRHLRAAAGFAFDPALLLRQLWSRLPFVVGLLACALWAAWRRRRSEKGRMALAGLATSLFVTALALGKPGATINYLMEPALASVIVLGLFPFRSPASMPARLALFAAVLLSFAWSSVATVRSIRDERMTALDERRALDRIRERCIDRPGAMVMATSPGVELAVNGRLYTHVLELSIEARHGRFPAQLWAEDAGSENVRCVVIEAWRPTAPPTPESPMFPDPVAAVMRERFRWLRRERGYDVYVAR